MDEIIRFCINHKDANVSFRYDENLGDMDFVEMELLVMKQRKPYRCKQVLVASGSMLENMYAAIELEANKKENTEEK